MVGSLKYFVYTTDDGEEFAIRRDESNIEGSMTLAGNPEEQGDYTPLSLPIYELPPNVKPRKVVFSSADGRVRREIVCLDVDTYDGITTTDTISQPTEGDGTLTLRLARKVGEVIRVPRSDDTGLTDGDQD